MSAGLRERLRAALPTAMKSRDRTAIAVLRTVLSTLDNAEAVGGEVGGQAIEQVAIGVGTTEAERRVLSEEEVAALVQQEVTERMSAAAAYERRGQVERAAQLRTEAAYLDGFR